MKAFPIYIYIRVELAILCSVRAMEVRIPSNLVVMCVSKVYILRLGTINLTRLTPIIPCPYLSISRNHKEYSVFLVVSVYRRSYSNRWKKFLSLSLAVRVFLS